MLMPSRPSVVSKGIRLRSSFFNWSVMYLNDFLIVYLIISYFVFLTFLNRLYRYVNTSDKDGGPDSSKDCLTLSIRSSFVFMASTKNSIMLLNQNRVTLLWFWHLWGIWGIIFLRRTHLNSIVLVPHGLRLPDLTLAWIIRSNSIGFQKESRLLKLEMEIESFLEEAEISAGYWKTEV